MELDDLQRIWAEQNEGGAYTLDEKALLARVKAGMPAARRLSGISEWLLTLIYLVTAAVLLYQSPLGSTHHIFLWVEGILFLLFTAYVLAHHFQRSKGSRQFDRSLRGDLEHMIFIARYQLRMAQLVRWSLLPIGILMAASGIESGKLLKIGIVILIAFPLAMYVNNRGFRVTQKRLLRLQQLKEKLDV